MGRNFIVTFVIQGKSFDVEIDPNQIIKDGIEKALQKAGISGNPDEWKAHTESGQQLDTNQNYEKQGITGPTKLFLTKGPGRGG